MQRSAWLVGTRPFALLVGLCLLLFTPGIAAIPTLDRDEARYVQATRQMLQTGDLLRIRFQDEARNRKPAGIYWLQALAVGAFSTAAATVMWPYRLPSLFGAVAAVLLTFALGAALFREEPAPRHVGAIAAVLLASAVGMVAEAHIAKTDAVLLAATTAGQGMLGVAYVTSRAGRPVAAWVAVVFWSAETAALMLKGPPGPGLALMTAATLSIIDRETRWLRGLRPLLGSAALTLAVAPWLFAIERASDGRFLADAFGQDLLPKLLQGRESHGAPPFSYILMILVTFWPGSLLLVHGGIRGWRRYRAPAERFLLAWILPAWALLELVPTKLPHYVLPLLPAVALLTAAAISNRAGEPCGSWPRRLDVLVRGLWVAITVGLAALLIGLPLRFGGAITAAGVLGAGSLVALAAMLLRRRPGPDRTAGAIAALSLAFAVPAGWSVLPGLDRLWLSRAAAQLVAQHAPAPGTPLVAVGYSEPSLVFLLGTKLRLTTPLGAADLLRGGGEALVSGRDDAAFRQDVGAHGLASRPVGSVAGLDYSNGQRLALTLYVVARNETAPE